MAEVMGPKQEIRKIVRFDCDDVGKIVVVLTAIWATICGLISLLVSLMTGRILDGMVVLVWAVGAGVIGSVVWCSISLPLINRFLQSGVEINLTEPLEEAPSSNDETPTE